MTVALICFVMFGAVGVFVGLRGRRNLEMWLVIPPVIISAAAGIWRAVGGDAALTLILSGMLVIFASAAAGALVGLAVGRSLQARRVKP